MDQLHKTLDGLLVISIEQAVAAPLCTMRLADAGARVIKIEPQSGETARHYDDVVSGHSAYFASLNRGKESVCLDLKADEDQVLLKRMLEKADVFVRNTGPGAMARMGLDGEDLKLLYPALITVDIVGYGQDTPYREMKAYDLLVQAESGLCSVTGTKETPCKVGVSIADMGTGMNAYAAVLEALIERGRTGVGKALEIAMFDSVAEWMSVPLLQLETGGKTTERFGLAHASIYPYRPYHCKDGDVLIAVQNNAQWRKLCDTILIQPALANDQRFSNNALRVQNREALDTIILNVTNGLNVATLIKRIEKAGIAYARLSTLEDLSCHTALRRQTVASRDTQSFLSVASPIPRFWNEPPKLPEIGEHTQSVREQFSSVQ
jgi:crotonobetainyl-CoA:carnitine CoA-transferase CaiB-like acyl-CoA transferase